MKQKITQGFVNQFKTDTGLAVDVMDTEMKGFILRVTPSGNRVFYVRYKRSNGKWTRYRLGSADVLTAALARDAAKEFLASVSLGGDPGDARRKAKAHNLGAFLSETYGPWVTENRKAGKSTINRLVSAFASLSNHRISELTPWTLEKWRAERRKKRGVRAATVNRDIATLSTALNYAVAWMIIESNPISGIKPLPETDSQVKTRYLVPEEESALQATLERREERERVGRDNHNQWRRERGYEELPSLRNSAFTDHLMPMILLSLNTGLRRGELFNLEWSDVDFTRNILTVQVANAKSGKLRHVNLNITAVDALKGWKSCYPGGKLVFPSKGGKPFNNVNSSWKSLLVDAGIVSFRWHDMRHDFASKLVMSGADLNTVRELLGHSDLKMTLRYAHLAPEVKAKAVEKLVKPNNVQPNIIQLPSPR